MAALVCDLCGGKLVMSSVDLFDDYLSLSQ